MATRFEKAEPDVLEIIQRMLKAYHQPLDMLGVTVECVMAFAEVDEETQLAEKPALTLGGYPVAAKVKVMGLADRTLGSADARISVDGDKWELLGVEERDALIDHECDHLELVLKVQDGQQIVQKDDLGRPKLKMRKHDHQHGWFDDIVRRHGASSPEWRQWEVFEEKRKAGWLPYVEVEGREELARQL
jgi:hypothetical protein